MKNSKSKKNSVKFGKNFFSLTEKMALSIKAGRGPVIDGAMGGGEYDAPEYPGAKQ